MRVKTEGWGVKNWKSQEEPRGTFTLLGRNPGKHSELNRIELKIVARCWIEKAYF